MRIEIDCNGHITERVCWNCPRTLPDGDGNFCGKCDTSALNKPRPRPLNLVVLRWLHEASGLALLAQDAFIEQKDWDATEWSCDMLNQITTFVAVPWPIGVDKQCLMRFYQDDQLLFDAVYAFAVRPEPDRVGELVRRIRQWFYERDRRLDRQDREVFEVN